MSHRLLPSFLLETISSKKKQPMQVRILDIQQLDDIYSLSHPFLTCTETIKYLRQTKVMFLMRGLPGSGKSTLVHLLERIYSGSVAVCSADHYFLDSHGVYNFNRDKIGEAHRVCQQHAEEACRNTTLAVIIDNTNIRADECRPYFQKASQYGYVVIIVEPRTPWKHDVDVLAARNTHQVPRDVIEARLRSYRPLMPFYFGLFLNHEQSDYVLHQAYGYYHQALQNFPQLKTDLEQISREKNLPVKSLLHRNNMSPQPKILHCTVKFIGKPTDQSRREYTAYATDRRVAHLLGKMCRVYIVGFTITPKTLAARLLLPDGHTWVVWDQDDNEIPSKPLPLPTNQKPRSARHQQKFQVTTTDDATTPDDYRTSMTQSMADDDLLLVDRVAAANESEQVSFLRPTFGFLSRAHLTCGVVPGVSASQSGLDMLDMIRQEGESIQSNASLDESADERTVMKFFGNGQCIVYLREPIAIQTIFSGNFQ